MGDTKKLRKKFETPRHPWNATRISLEKNIMRKYGVVNKREIWRAESVLKRFKTQAKSLLVRTDDQANKERQQMIDKMIRLGLVSKGAGVDDVLGVQLKDVMDRRLQTIVLKNRLARSVKHARQMITHEHILVGKKKVTSPSYLVEAAEESFVGFAPDSPFIRSDHGEAFDEEVAQKRLARQKAKAERAGNDFDEIIVFEKVEDLDKVTKKDVDASVQNLKVDDKAPKKKVVKKAPEKQKEEKKAEEKPKAKPKVEKAPEEKKTEVKPKEEGKSEEKPKTESKTPEESKEKAPETKPTEAKSEKKAEEKPKEEKK